MGVEVRFPIKFIAECRKVHPLCPRINQTGIMSFFQVLNCLLNENFSCFLLPKPKSVNKLDHNNLPEGDLEMEELCLKPLPTAQCPVVVNETVCLEADIIIFPKIEVGEIRCFCVGNPVVSPCERSEDREEKPIKDKVCCFTVQQKINVQIPLVFSARPRVIARDPECSAPVIDSCIRDEEE
ncbi:MAG: hypothetical protein PHD36_08785 [Desulfotomaculaceae bacterium]|nr:hypothetical protein [Desulfotomaculaceae bacterium]